MQKSKLFRTASRLFFLIIALLAITAGPLPSWIANIMHQSKGGFREDIQVLPSWLSGAVPQSSPLCFIDSMFADSAAGHVYPASIFCTALAMLILLTAIWKGRFFCRWICPAGTLHSAVSRFGMKKHPFKLRVSAYLFWTMLFSFLAGYPLFMFLDPLCQFSRLGAFFEETLVLAAMLPALILPFFLILSFFQPELWCAFFCPLGYLFSLLHRKPEATIIQKVNKDRREMIAGFAVGAPVALLLANYKKVFAQKEEKDYPVLPPGALPSDAFSAACIRCYACVNVCPTKILSVKFPHSGDLTRWFQPEMDAEKGVCAESCVRCTEVCPVNAISTLKPEEKRLRQIGIAYVIKEACLAWADAEHCMVCSEYCPYLAIDIDNDKNGIPRPVVNAHRCRGCGFCQNSCPAVKKGKAIIVAGLPEQNKLEPK